MTTKKTAVFLLQVIICLFVTAPNVLAVSGQLNLEQPEPQISQPPSMFWLFIKLVISLAVIVGLTYLTVKVLRRKLTYSSAGDSISVLDQHAFAMNKGIYITEVAGRVYVLGVTDHNISILSEINDAQVIAGLRSRAQERLNEPVIPPGLLEKFLPRLKNRTLPQTPSFGTHIQEQIRKLHSLVEKSKTQKRDDDTDGR
ncbi:MAG: FliO/MopB family protein [Bacillota bacterium]